MTTATAGNLAGQAGEKDKEKMEKRRALGRGLASLLPGPRVVSPPVAPPASSTAPSPSTAPTPSTARVAGTALGATAPVTAAPVPAALASAAARAAAANLPHSSDGAPQVGERAAVSGSVSASELSAGVGTRTGASAPHERALSADPVELGDQPQEVVWPEDKAPGPNGMPAYDSQAADGTFTMQAAAETRMPGNLVFNLPIADIDKNPFQTRYVDDDDALEELADSIKANGVVQPIMVRPSEDEKGRYVLVLGERRLHASKKAGKTHIPALVRRVSRQQAAEMTIVENLQREDLSPLEQAQSFKVLSEEFDLTQEEIGKRVGLSRVSVANYMRLLRLPRDVMQMLAEKRINFAQAKELLKLGDNDRIAEAALYAVKKGMNIEQIEMLVLRMDGLLDPLPDMPGVKKKERSTGARWTDPNVRAAQMELERTLGLRVRIRDRKGKGKIVIEYATVDDYERVVEMLRHRK
jgi:ParB family transcriptional regulator, chromosome partitioning protein